MLVHDSGVPTKSASTSVRIRVTRDERLPEFSGGPYTAPTVAEDVDVNHIVISIKGRDRDQTVSSLCNK